MQNIDERDSFGGQTKAQFEETASLQKRYRSRTSRLVLRTLDDAKRIQLIAETKGCRIGQIRFDKEKYGNFAPDCWTVSIDISLEKALRGKGLSSEIVLQGIEHVKVFGKKIYLSWLAFSTLMGLAMVALRIPDLKW